MPEIFLEMARKSDEQLFNELRAAVWAAYSKDKKPIAEAAIIKWLSNKVTADRIPRVLEIAERSGLLTRYAGTRDYVPGTMDKTQME